MIIGIGGVSRSGKSHLALQLVNRFKSACVLSMDDYTYPKDLLPKIRDRYDWERPEAYDFDKLIAELTVLRENYLTVIIEGILIYHDPRIAEIIDKKLFLEIAEDTFLKRRMEEKRWGNEPQWFISHVWKSYEKYDVQNYSDFIYLNSENPLNIDSVMNIINSQRHFQAESSARLQ